MELSGKLAIVTGASRGIGRSLTIEFAKSGCNLLLTALEDRELSALSDELQTNFSIKVAIMAADLSECIDRKKFIDWVKNLEDSPDILVNNAGIGGHFGRFEYLDWGSIEKTLSLNISAFTHLTYELIPILKKRPQAKIVNISSGIARLPYPGLSVYGATKGFVSSFSESLSCELAGTNISILCFHPGFAMTPFIKTAEMDLRKIPKVFLHSPEEIAAQIVRAIRKDKFWAYSDFFTRFGAWLGAIIPARLRIFIFKDLFWRLPNAK